jgi:hypothetical protein
LTAAVSIQFTPQFERAMNRGDGVVIVLMSPSELPGGTPNAPSPVTNWSDVQV